MTTHNTNLDAINNICSLVKEIIELVDEIPEDELMNCSFPIGDNLDLISCKASMIKIKAQKMENRLREYKSTIESLGFKRSKKGK